MSSTLEDMQRAMPNAIVLCKRAGQLRWMWHLTLEKMWLCPSFCKLALWQESGKRGLDDMLATQFGPSWELGHAAIFIDTGITAVEVTTGCWGTWPSKKTLCSANVSAGQVQERAQASWNSNWQRIIIHLQLQQAPTYTKCLIYKERQDVQLTIMYSWIPTSLAIRLQSLSITAWVLEMSHFGWT